MSKYPPRTMAAAINLCIATVVCCWPAEASEPVNRGTLKLTAGDDGEVLRCIRESGHPEEFRETRYVDDSPMPVLRPDEKERGYLVFRRPWMQLIFPNSIPRREEITDRFIGIASPGECEPITFCMRTLRELRGLEIEAGELVSQQGNRLKAPEVQLVRCAPRALRGEEWLYEGGPVGVMNMPTYLEKPRPIDVAAGRTVQYWLTVKVEKDRPAGMYRGEVRIRDDVGKPLMLKVALRVLPTTLIEPPHALGFWDFQRPYREEIGTLNEVYQVMREHGMSALFARVGLFDYDKATDTYDFQRFISIDESGKVTVRLEGSSLETSMEAAKNAGLKWVIYTPSLSLLATEEVLSRYDRQTLDEQTDAEIPPVLKRFQGSKQFNIIKSEVTNAARKHFPMYSDAYADLYVEIVSEILKEVKKRDWPKLVLSLLDEAYGHHVHGRTAFPFVLRHLELMKRAGAMTTLNHCAPTMGGEYGEYVRAAMKYLAIAVPGGRLSRDASQTSPYNATLDQVVAGFAKEGVATWNYSLSGQAGGVFPDLSVVRFSAGYFFHTLGEGVVGNIDYIFFRPEGDPYNPVADFNPADRKRLWSHERVWFFPPREQAGRLGGRSLSLAAKREGYDDLRYLHTLNVLIERAQSKTDSPIAQQGARSAIATRKRILGSFHFSDEALDSNRRNSWSRWDKVIAAPDSRPAVVKGALRLRNGWKYEQYDLCRREIAEEIIALELALKPAEQSR